MIKISEKMDKLNTCKCLVVVVFHFFYFQELFQTKHFFNTRKLEIEFLNRSISLL